MLQQVTDAVVRDLYDAITAKCIPPQISGLVDKILKKMNVDRGFVSDGKWWESLNSDVYGYDVDRQLAVIQLRRAIRKRSWSYQKVQKQYFLLGIDDHQLFSHPIPGSPRRMGGAGLYGTSPEGVVKWAEAKIFGVTVEKLSTVIRQGDIAIVPQKRTPADLYLTDDFTLLPSGIHQGILRNSHTATVDGDVFSTNITGRWFADGNIEIVHSKGEHRAIAYSGKAFVVVGERDGIYGWVGTPLGD